MLLLFVIQYSPLAVFSHGGAETEAPKQTAAPGGPQTSIVSAERNLQTDGGNFNLILLRSPGDARAGEATQFLIKLAEKVEGGFGSGGGMLPLDKAAVTVSVTKADGTQVAEKLPVAAEANGSYRTSYDFGSTGDYKIVINVATDDNRRFSADFPVSITSAPVRSSFWYGLAFLTLLALGSLAAIFYASKRRGEGVDYRRFAPFAVAVLLIFAFGTMALAYFVPPRETRNIAAIPANASATTGAGTAASAIQTSLTVPKDSQILFGITTALVESRKITAGLKVAGTVRARPDAKAVVSPPVAGKIVLRQGLSIGSAVGRGEQIGTIEQVLSAEAQASLESQRVAVETQRLNVEAQRIQLKNNVLEQQARQAEQRASAQQARSRLAQAQRELRRAENLVEVGAAAKRRLEEAQTAVRVAQQEVGSAEQQVKLLDVQIRQSQAAQTQIRDYNPVALTRSFPLAAPVTGIVNEIKATSGQQVEAGTELLTIVNLSTVLIEAQVFEKDLPIVREANRASFTSAALNGEVYTIGTADGDGRLVSVGQTVNEQTRTVPVIYEVINPFQRLRDGMFVEMTIDTSGDRQVLAVPKQAVITEQGQSFVFVFDGGENFTKTAVALGAEGSDYYEVKSGIEAGERVVVNGIYQLRSTQPSA